MQEIKSLIEHARTCRRFEEDAPLTMADLEWLVECARMVPSARNQQEVRYTLVQSREARLALFDKTVWAGALKDWKGPYEGERPTGFIILSTPPEPSRLTLVDVGIVAQTIQLAASSRGWGCCIIASFDGQSCRSIGQLPEGQQPILVLGLGKEKEIRKIAPVPASGALGYWRDENQVHYVPKRSVDELILARI